MTLNFSRTLDKAIVHRTAVAEVFVTAATQVTEDEYQVGVQVPRHHGLYSDALCSTGCYDPLFFLEACRQSAYVVLHGFHEVPLDRKFILREASVRVADADLLTIGETPIDAVVHVRILRRIRNRDREFVGFRGLLQVKVGGCVAVECEINASWTTARGHDALRAKAREELGFGAEVIPCPPLTRAPAELVNRRLPLNVVISQPYRDGVGAYRAGLIADTTHPTLFDHPVDHVPGMLAVEACRQLALSVLGSGWRLDRLSARFLKFVEFDLPAYCVAELPEPQDQDEVRVLMRVLQGDRSVLKAEVGLVRSSVTVLVGSP